MTKALSASLVVTPGKRADLRARDPGDLLGMAEKSTDRQRLEALTERLAELQNWLGAESTRSVLLVLQGMDASGKDGAIRRVFSGVNPQGCGKFQKADLDARAHWDEFQRVYEEALTETSTDWAPWYVAPADHKWVRDVAIAGLLVEVLDQLDPQVPPPEPGLDGIVVV